MIFGPTGIPGGDFDIAEIAEITTDDPSDWYDLWRCGSAANYTGYCSVKASKLMQQGNCELNPTKRVQDYHTADALMAAAVPNFPSTSGPFRSSTRAASSG